MRAFVFTDVALGRQAGRFVWLSINTEKRENAPVIKRYPIAAWPSFYVIDPKAETVALRWVGGASVAQIQKVLDDGEKAVRGGGHGLEEALVSADRLYGAGKTEEAAAAYRALLARAPDGWPPYARVTENLLFSLGVGKKPSECVALARDAWPRLKDTSSAANVAGSGLDCALSLPDGAPDRSARIAEFAGWCRALTESARADLAADDIASVYLSLADERQAAKDEAGRKKTYEAMAAFLEGKAAAARTPQERTVFDPHRLTAYLALGQPERAIPMLEASARDFPDDYNPPARLAAAYVALKRWDDAVAAADRALALAYGPRKLRIFVTKADALEKKGDVAGARRTLELAMAHADGLPEEQRPASLTAALKKRLAALPPG